MAISRFAASRVTQGLPKYQSAWDQDNVAQGALEVIQTYYFSTRNRNILFSNIPQTYQHLLLQMDLRGTDSFAQNQFSVYVNSSGVGVASRTTLQGDGTSATSYRQTTSTPTYGFQGWLPGGTSTAGIFGMAQLYFLNYANTTTNKTIIGKSTSHVLTEGRLEITAMNQGSNSAITNMTFDSTSNFEAGSIITLYGIKAGV